MISTSDALIAAAKCLRLGAAEHIVAAALQGDGFSPKKVELMVLWCKQYNKRISNEQGTIQDDQRSDDQNSADLSGTR